MKRDIGHKLLDWKVSPRRKPLILNGARQVGKTYALQHFAKNHYEKKKASIFERGGGIVEAFL